jgi:hypothetical protein
MKTYKDFVNEELTSDINVGDVLICIHSGVISISQGDEAYSSDAIVGNTFTVTDVTRNKFWIFGKLNIKGDYFERRPNLSGKNPEQLNKIPININGIEYAISKDFIDGKTEDDFWSCWKTK